MLLEVELFDDVLVVSEAPVVSFCSPSSEQANRMMINKVTIKFLCVIFMNKLCWQSNVSLKKLTYILFYVNLQQNLLF